MRSGSYLALAAVVSIGAVLWVKGTDVLTGGSGHRTPAGTEVESVPGAVEHVPASPGSHSHSSILRFSGRPQAEDASVPRDSSSANTESSAQRIVGEPGDRNPTSGSTPGFEAGSAKYEPFEERDEDDGPANPYAVAGRVLDDTGAAVSGVEVTAELRRLYTLAEGMDESEIERNQSARTGHDGAYYFPGLADGEYQIRTVATDHYTEARATVRAGVGSADLVVRRKHGQLQIYGVASTAKGIPLDGVQVLPTSQPAAATYSDAAGAYTLELDLTGSRDTYAVRFRCDGYRDQTFALEPAFYDGFESIPLDVALEPLDLTGNVSGSVTNGAGEPVTGERVALFSRQRNRTYTVLTDDTGFFSFADIVPATDYWIEIRPTGGRYRDFKRTGLKVGTEALDVPVVLQSLDTASLAGQILDVQGVPIPYLTLWLRSRHSVGDTYQVTSDDQGQFLVEDVPAGPLSLESGASPLFEINGVYLPAGTENDLDLVVDWGTYALEGQVLDSSGQPVPATDVYLTWRQHEGAVTSVSIRRTTADAQGRFTFTRLGPGPHSLSVDKVPGFDRVVFDHYVGPSKDPVVVQLQESDW